MKKPVVLIASLRNNARYTGPLRQIEDNVYYCLDRYMKNEGRDKYDYRFFKTSFDGRRPASDVDVAQGIDAIVAVSVVEWTYHIPNFRHQYDQAKSDAKVMELGKYLDGKNFVLISHEQADTLELFRDRTFKGVKFGSMSQIHQEEMGNEFMHMRYEFIQDHIKKIDGEGLYPSPFPPTYNREWFYKKNVDFVYWGCSKTKTVGGVKSGDERQKVLTEIWKQAKGQNYSTFFQGKYDKIKKDASWTNDFSQVIPSIAQGTTSLCFQWPGKEHLPTTRYPEALACGIVPLVWQNFDQNGAIYGHDVMQEVQDVDEVIHMIRELQDPNFAYSIYRNALDGFVSRPGKLTRDQVYQKFITELEKKMP